MNDNILINQARSLSQNGKAQDALTLLDNARIKQNSAALLIEMATILSGLGAQDDAIKILDEGLRSFPDNPSMAIVYANHTYIANQPTKGLKATTRWIALPNCSPELLLTHAHLLKANGDVDAAETFYKKVLALDPANSSALVGIGGIELDNSNYAAALDALRKALSADPQNALIKTQLAYAEFRSGDLAQGWQHYNARFENIVKHRSFTQPQWNGKVLQNGKLLVWGEQGVGEEILYSSMFNDARRLCQDGLIVECDARLKALFERSFHGITFIARCDPPDSALTHTSIVAQSSAGQLGQVLRNSFDTFPIQAKLLTPDESKVAQLKARYADLKRQYGKEGRVIGVSWKSKPLRQGDPKSSSIADWAPLFENSPHLFVSLQYGDIADDLALAKKSNWTIIDDTSVNQRASLDDFAAQISALDEVITVSNTTAHMAGACGIKTCVLLPRARGLMWHWFDKEKPSASLSLTTSPWYPSVTLLRQQQDGMWADAIEKAKNSLE
ncbi:MAG: tetratricopeptide repeat protein [Alphaproteobacteria bacterium]|nr:tetratricopeptide repeat protein [Alphaproteobacteria bacterium]